MTLDSLALARGMRVCKEDVRRKPLVILPIFDPRDWVDHMHNAYCSELISAYSRLLLNDVFRPPSDNPICYQIGCVFY